MLPRDVREMAKEIRQRCSVDGSLVVRAPPPPSVPTTKSVSLRMRSNSHEQELLCESPRKSNATPMPSSAVVLTGRIRPSKIPRRGKAAMLQSSSFRNTVESSFSSVSDRVGLATDAATGCRSSAEGCSSGNSVSAARTESAADGGEPEVIVDEPTIPLVPLTTANMPIHPQGLQLVQTHINSYGYNHTSVPFYHMRKTGGTCHVLDIVRDIHSLAMPIQCVEAVFLGIALTACWSALDRIPLSFKSKFESHCHRHIVLAVHTQGRWGALGISRRACLMDKPLRFSSLWELIEDYQSSYESVFHKLLSVYVGMPLPHNLAIDQQITWKAIKLRMELTDEENNKSEIGKYLRKAVRHYATPTSTQNGRR